MISILCKSGTVYRQLFLQTARNKSRYVKLQNVFSASESERLTFGFMHDITSIYEKDELIEKANDTLFLKEGKFF